MDRLVRKQLVTRCENAVDRRLVILAATPSGESALSNVRAAHLARLHLALSTFSCDDQARLLELLERFLLAALSDVASVQECCRRCGTEHNGACVVNEAHMALLGRPIEGT